MTPLVPFNLHTPVNRVELSEFGFSSPLYTVDPGHSPWHKAALSFAVIIASCPRLNARPISRCSAHVNARAEQRECSRMFKKITVHRAVYVPRADGMVISSHNSLRAPIFGILSLSSNRSCNHRTLSD
jgi:hypothetical protein